MRQELVSSSEARKQLPFLMQKVDEQGKVIVLTVYGKKKAALIDIDLLEELIENIEFGISEKELLRRSKEKRMSLNELRQSLDV